MGTRGFLGFVVDGEEKIAYNHSCSYPAGLGLDVLRWLRSKDPGLLAARARGLRVVREREDIPTDEDIERLARWTDLTVGGRSERPQWYQLLRETQGDPAAIFEAGFIEDESGFPLNSLFAEWGYVVDLDERTLEGYEGFQTTKHGKGRFAGRLEQHTSITDEYYEVALAATWPLDGLPTDQEFVVALRGERS